ncbi:MAG: isoamylase early set domain-containing protein [Anaerolineae bacterium]
MIKKELGLKAGLARVTFELPSTVWADQVSLVGEFNNWDRQVTPMTQDRLDESWRATLDLEAGRRYRFRYLLDGDTWLSDRQADGCAATSTGAYDSVVDLTGFEDRISF